MSFFKIEKSGCVGRLQTSTLRRKINAEDWEGAKMQLMKWVYGGGRILNGLVKRRAVEASYIRCAAR